MGINTTTNKRHIKGFAKFLFAIIALWFLVHSKTQAQRYIAGFEALEFRAGIVENDGITANFGYSKYTRGKNRILADVDYLQRNYPYDAMKIPLRQFTISAGKNFLLFSDESKTFFTSVGSNVLLGYELIHDGKKRLADGAEIVSEDKFIYGLTLNLEMEYFFDDNKIIIGGLRQRVLLGSSVTPFHVQFFIGFKYILNTL